MSFNVESLGKGSAKIVSSNGSTDIFELPIPEIQELFKKSGVLLFRGFGVAPKQLQELASRYSSQFVHEGARKGFSGFIEEVDQGTAALPLHSESANSPFRPELVWFCCGRPADSGGQTLYCDGVALWNDLQPSTQDLFLKKKVKYKRNYKPDVWQRFAQPNGTFEELQATLSPIPGVAKLELKDDGSVDSEYVVKAVSKTKFGGERAFANTVIGAFRNAYRGTELVFEDDSAIPIEVLEEAEAVGEKHAEDIFWQAGDVAMIDNSWFMHGRRKFEDEQRMLVTVLTYANF